MSSKRILGRAVAASAFASSAALAATEAPECVRGTVASATPDSVTVDTCADNPVKVALKGNTTYLKVEKSNLNKVEKGGYVGTATKNIGGTQVALAAEGHYARDKIADTTLSGARGPAAASRTAMSLPSRPRRSR